MILSRREGETVTIPTPQGEIVIGLSKCKHGKASLVLQVPNCLDVFRTELGAREEIKTVWGPVATVPERS